MKRILISLLIVLLALASFFPAASAAASHLSDEAGLLSDAERGSIETQLSALSEAYDLDLVIVTTDSTGSKTPMEYADDYYDYNGYRPDGVLLLISMEAGDWWISTAG